MQVTITLLALPLWELVSPYRSLRPCALTLEVTQVFMVGLQRKVTACSAGENKD